MSNLSGNHHTFALAFSRSIKSHRHPRTEVAQGAPNSRRDRAKSSRLVGFSSSRTIRLNMPAITVEEADAIQPTRARMRPPSRFGDKAFECFTLTMAMALVVLVILISWELWQGS